MPKLFEKGHDPRRNIAGRPKGAQNKSVEQIRKTVKDFIANNIETIQADFDSLEPKDRLNFIEKLFKHILPAPLHPLEQLTEEQLRQLITDLKNGKYE